jgi:hypothetical protein
MLSCTALLEAAYCGGILPKSWGRRTFVQSVASLPRDLSLFVLCQSAYLLGCLPVANGDAACGQAKLLVAAEPKLVLLALPCFFVQLLLTKKKKGGMGGMIGLVYGNKWRGERSSELSTSSHLWLGPERGGFGLLDGALARFSGPFLESKGERETCIEAESIIGA